MDQKNKEPDFIDFRQAAKIMEDYFEYTLMTQDRLRDYGNGDQISYTQVHLLDMIRINPGINATELATKKRRKKSTISQILALLEDKGYIYRVPSEQDLKTKGVYLTENGKELCRLHEAYDQKSIKRSYVNLLENCTPEEIQTSLKVLAYYTGYLKKRNG